MQAGEWSGRQAYQPSWGFLHLVHWLSGRSWPSNPTVQPSCRPALKAFRPTLCFSPLFARQTCRSGRRRQSISITPVGHTQPSSLPTACHPSKEAFTPSCLARPGAPRIFREATRESTLYVFFRVVQSPRFLHPFCMAFTGANSIALTSESRGLCLSGGQLQAQQCHHECCGTLRTITPPWASSMSHSRFLSLSRGAPSL